MNSKERALRTLEREELPDRVPLEEVAWGEWSYPFLQQLLRHLGYGEGGSVIGSSEQLDPLIKQLGIDFRGISMNPPTNFQKLAVNDPRFHMPWGILVAEDTILDEWGIRRQLNETKTQSRVIFHPLQEKDGLEDYVFPDPEAPGRFDEAEQILKKWGDRYGISCLWGSDGFWSQAWYLRGFNNFILDMHSNEAFANQLLDELEKIYRYATKRFVEMEHVDIITIADDVAGQRGMIISPVMFRKYLKPRYMRLVKIIKKAGKFALWHSDGNFEPIIRDIIEIGFDIINPVQSEAMNPAEIKQRYGGQLILSGTISVQETLPFGTVENVKQEVIQRIKTCGYDGGLILSPSNQALLDVKIENFLAVYDTAKKFRKYPLTI